MSLGIMQRTIPFFFALSTTSALAPAAGCVQEPHVAEHAQATSTPNNWYPNGISINGATPNNWYPNGISLQGISLQGISLQGAVLSAATGAAPWSGAAVVGSTWIAELTGGGQIPLRIDAAAPLAGANADLWSYEVSYEVGGERHPLCAPAAGGAPGVAITAPGTWNLAQGVPGGGSYQPAADQFTVACRGSSIAKCVELGYRPWLGYEEQVAACVRAMRADFCGDGTPYTVTGTIINLYDAVGLQVDDQPWRVEAEWTPGGARCIRKQRDTRFHRVAQTRPSCVPQELKARHDCGEGLGSAATLVTELPPM
jgi:hypothetical protein